jgi:hypothetical protein
MDERYDYVMPEKSTFITVLAVIFIVLAGFNLLGQTASMMLLPLISQRFGISENLQEQMNNGTMPLYTRLFFGHFFLFTIVLIAASIIKLIAAIGLLLRKNWARILFIIVVFCAIAFRIFGFVIQLFSTPQLPNTPQSNEQFLQMVMLTTRIFSFIFTVGVCVLYGWIITKLLSEKIRREFIPELQLDTTIINSEQA